MILTCAGLRKECKFKEGSEKLLKVQEINSNISDKLRDFLTSEAGDDHDKKIAFLEEFIIDMEDIGKGNLSLFNPEVSTQERKRLRPAHRDPESSTRSANTSGQVEGEGQEGVAVSSDPASPG